MSNLYAFVGHEPLRDALKDRLAKAGFEYSDDLTDAHFVLTYCSNLSFLEDTYFDDDGLLLFIKPGTVVIDLSPCTPSMAAEMSAVITLSDSMMVEAPLIVKDQVSDDAFAKSNIACFAAGDDKSLAEAMPVLEAIYGDVTVVGGPGVAQLAKSASTLQRAAETFAAVEAYSLMRASRQSVSSIEIKDFRIPATSPEAYYVLKAIEEERYEGDFTIEMLMGEVNAALMAGDDFGCILPQAESAFSMMEILAIVGGSDKNPAALELIFRNDQDEAMEKYGLDWSRMENGIFASRYDDEDDYFDDDEDDSFLDFPNDDGFTSMGFSSN